MQCSAVQCNLIIVECITVECSAEMFLGSDGCRGARGGGSLLADWILSSLHWLMIYCDHHCIVLIIVCRNKIKHPAYRTPVNILRRKRRRMRMRNRRRQRRRRSSWVERRRRWWCMTSSILDLARSLKECMGADKHLDIVTDILNQHTGQISDNGTWQYGNFGSALNCLSKLETGLAALKINKYFSFLMGY